MSIQKPTHIQQKGIPPLVEGRDTLIRSKTGTGKTLTYVLPIVQALQAKAERISRNDGTRALILVPTRELAVQVTGVVDQVNAVSTVIMHCMCCKA